MQNFTFQIPTKIYFGKETSKEEIQKFASNHYGEYGGYAQQYLFFYHLSC